MNNSTNNYMDNMGGINKIYPIELSQIKSFSDIADSKVNTFEVYELESLAVDKEQTGFSEEQKKSNAGYYFNANVSAFFNKDQYELANWLNENINRKFIVVVTYNNGIIKVIGTPNQPLKLSANSEAGTIENINGFNINFSKRQPRRAYFLDALPTVVAP